MHSPDLDHPILSSGTKTSVLGRKAFLWLKTSQCQVLHLDPLCIVLVMNEHWASYTFKLKSNWKWILLEKMPWHWLQATSETLLGDILCFLLITFPTLTTILNKFGASVPSLHSDDNAVHITFSPACHLDGSVASCKTLVKIWPNPETSLVVQWLTVFLPVQGTWVQFSVLGRFHMPRGN